MADSGRTGKARRSRAREASPKEPALPAWKAFVVQFSRETGVDADAYCGRIEHLSSGQRARFSSQKQLLAFIDAVLEARGEMPAKRQRRDR